MTPSGGETPFKFAWVPSAAVGLRVVYYTGAAGEEPFTVYVNPARGAAVVPVNGPEGRFLGSGLVVSGNDWMRSLGFAVPPDVVARLLFGEIRG